MTTSDDLEDPPGNATVAGLGRLGGLVAGVPALRLKQRIKKPNEELTFKVVGDVHLGHLHRKLINVLIRVAQDERQPGLRLPPPAYYPADFLETARQYFWAPLEEFVRDTRFDSNDTKLLRNTLEELQQLRVTSDGPDWLSEVPVSSVRFLSAPGRATWVGFAFAPEARRLITRPRAYTELLLLTQQLLHSGPAIALYERCRQYLTSPGRKTARAPWVDWYYWLSGVPTSKPPPRYKYWNRDTLKRIEAEINAVSDIHIKRIEYRVGRQVEDLQYEVSENKQMSIKFPGKPPIDTELRSRVVALGVPSDRADRYISEYDDGRLRANLEYVQQALKRGGIRVSPEAYFRAALKENYAGNIKTAAATISSLSPRPSNEREVREQFLADRARQAWELFREQEQGEQERLVAGFLESTNKMVRDQHKRAGLDSPMVRSSFSLHYAQSLWGDPGAEEVLAFASQRLADLEAAAAR